MKEKLLEFLKFSLDTDMGEKSPIPFSNLRNKGFVNLHGIAAVQLPLNMKDYTLYYENGKCYAIPLTYDKVVEERKIICDEQVLV
jgi:hypothetical protein